MRKEKLFRRGGKIMKNNKWDPSFITREMRIIDCHNSLTSLWISDVKSFTIGKLTSFKLSTFLLLCAVKIRLNQPFGFERSRKYVLHCHSNTINFFYIRQPSFLQKCPNQSNKAHCYSTRSNLKKMGPL